MNAMLLALCLVVIVAVQMNRSQSALAFAGINHETPREGHKRSFANVFFMDGFGGGFGGPPPPGMGGGGFVNPPGGGYSGGANPLPYGLGLPPIGIAAVRDGQPDTQAIIDMEIGHEADASNNKQSFLKRLSGWINGDDKP